MSYQEIDLNDLDLKARRLRAKYIRDFFRRGR